MKRHTSLFAAARAFAAVLVLVGGSQAWGQAGTPAYPAKPVRLVVAAVAGSSADILARLVGESYSQQNGQPWIVDNRPGAGGILGSDVVAKAPADGYTLLLTANNFVISPAIYPQVPYDVLRDFAPVGLVTQTPTVLFINSSTGVKDMTQLAALAKSTPGGMNYGAPFIGTSAHLIMEMLKRSSRMDLTFIPSKGTPQAFTEALAGRVPLIAGNIADAGPHVKAGSLTPLAVAASTRSPLLPQVPTLREAGHPGLELPLWFALYAPAGTPPELLARINAQLGRALSAPALVQGLTERGFESIGAGTPEQLAAQMRREMPLYAKVAAEAGVKP